MDTPSPSAANAAVHATLRTTWLWAAALLTVLLLVLCFDHWRFGRIAQPVTGVVTRIHRSSDSCGRNTFERGCFSYEADVKYAVDGQSYGVRLNGGVDRPDGHRGPRYSLGQRVRLLYDPGRPARAHSARHGMSWIGPLCVLVLQLGCLLGALAAHRRARPAPAEAAVW
jgi:hypothetical protein